MKSSSEIAPMFRHVSYSRPLCLPSRTSLASCSRLMASQDFDSSLVLAEAQVSSLAELEPAFEHLLRDVGLQEVSSNTGWKGLERANNWRGPVGVHPRERGLSVEVVENRPVYVKSWGSVASVLSRSKGSGSPFNLGSVTACFLRANLVCFFLAAEGAGFLHAGSPGSTAWDFRRGDVGCTTLDTFAHIVNSTFPVPTVAGTPGYRCVGLSMRRFRSGQRQLLTQSFPQELFGGLD